ncbi:hypothetical protein VTK73DRAFT_8261 [Phialemonium thermophilum]|uniref:Nucleotidyl transferase AbiEii toxin, Type IV TA system n=1 Tax=Phialemonium thermophilum TaxID=223376 RepID=A0ABR3XR86_9PEZI
MEKALKLLDSEIAKSELLMSVAPIRLITIGGSLAVRLCLNRRSTRDIDCMLDPNVAAAEDYADEFWAAATRTCEKGGFPRGWLAQQAELFVARERRMALFLESVEQGVVVFQGANVVIYAGLLSWALERKLRRIAHAPDRKEDQDVDIADAAALVRLVRSPGDPPLSFQYIRELNFNGFELPPEEYAIREVAEHYAQVYGEVGLAEKIWDDDAGRWKYQGLHDEWVWW